MQYFYLCGSCKNVMCSECHDKEEKIAVGKPEKKIQESKKSSRSKPNNTSRSPRSSSRVRKNKFSNITKEKPVDGNCNGNHDFRLCSDMSYFSQSKRKIWSKSKSVELVEGTCCKKGCNRCFLW